MEGAKRGQKKTGTISERDLRLISCAYWELFSIKNYRPSEKEMQRFVRRFHHKERAEAKQKQINRKVAELYIDE